MVHVIGKIIHPRKRRNTERGPEAGIRGACGFEEQGGGMYGYRGGFIP